jgi:hypothetical protein
VRKKGELPGREQGKSERVVAAGSCYGNQQSSGTWKVNRISVKKGNSTCHTGNPHSLSIHVQHQLPRDHALGTDGCAEYREFVPQILCSSIVRHKVVPCYASTYCIKLVLLVPPRRIAIKKGLNLLANSEPPVALLSVSVWDLHSLQLPLKYITYYYITL